jgi:ketosteroid isomerase-like protein
MKRALPPALAVLMLAASLTSVVAQPRPGGAPVAPQLRPVVRQMEEATSRFINGDVSLWDRLVSHRDQATIMGGWGGYEKGWDQVGPRYRWASGQMGPSGAKVRVEYLASGISGDMAYTVAIERSEMRLAKDRSARPLALRVTHIYRKEDGNWKLVHRHADPLMEKVIPGAAPPPRRR